jgi:hypothetical protein
MSKTQAPVPTCPLCGVAFQLGVQHKCSSQNESALGPGFWIKLFVPLFTVLLLQLGGAIWWASGVQNDLRQVKDQQVQQSAYFKEQLDRQQQIIDRLDSYFRRPPPQ